MRNKAYLPKTAVEITYPEGTQLFVIVENRKDETLECCEVSKERKSGLRFAMPLAAFVEAVAELPQPLRKMAALKAMLEISKAGGFALPEGFAEFTESSLDSCLDFIHGKRRYNHE